MKKSPAQKKAPAKKPSPSPKASAKKKATPKETSPSLSSKQEQDRWATESDVRTLMSAEEIKADAKRLARANAHAQEQAQKLSKVAGKK